MPVKTNVLHPLQIGDLVLPHNIIVAPLAGISDFPFRKLVRNFGAGLIYTEMIPVTALVANPQKNKRYYQFHINEHPIGIQLVGKDENLFLKAIEILAPLQPDLIELNFSCPVRKIVHNGSGAALLKEPEKLEKLTRLVVRHSPIPITAKIRIGYDENSLNALEIAQRLEQAGIAMLTVHGRTRKQMYSGNVRWDLIQKIKKRVRIPVIGNGGIYHYKDVVEKIQQSGVDGIQIASGLFGRYWFIQEILLQREITLSEKEMIQLILDYYQLMMAEYPEQIAVPRMRKHLIWLSKYCERIKNRLNDLVRSHSFQEIKEILMKSADDMEKH